MSSGSGTQQIISLPKGGGAVRGIGESFKPNIFNGTGGWTIPIALSPGRGNFTPALSLQYSAGSGNGLFGFGWDLDLPSIVRKTEKGLPRYDDTDVFLLSGTEDLVRVATGTLHDGFLIDRYRPRVEGSFARIERWRHELTGDTHWRVTSGANVTRIFGGSAASRIADPDDPSRVYEWLLDQTFDAFGNRMIYEYARDADDAAPSDIFERGRRTTQRYPRRICYGTLASPVAYADGAPVGCQRDGRHYLFEVVFDYGDWDLPTIDPHPLPPVAGTQESFGAGVPVRPDVFSSFEARFDVRTLRRCQRVLMFHHFAELGQPTLVRSTDFEYSTDPDTLISFLESVTTTGYVRSVDGAFTSARIPSLTFEYSKFTPETQRFRSLAVQGDDLPPTGLDDANMALVDLFGDGLSDLLQGTPNGFRYWRNLGDGRLDRPRSMPQIPAGVSLGARGVAFGDMGGDARADLLVHAETLPGFYETTSAGTWKKFRPYATAPTFDLADPDLRMLDLTGDGLTDALMTTAGQFLWFQCLGERGFAAPETIPRRHDADLFPDVFFNDPDGRVRLAAICGGPLSDIVLVHDDRIDYWPNLGYGHFGRRITMAGAPRLGVDFDPERLFLVDLNGTGCADLVYVEHDRVHFWFNRNGNAWSDRRTIRGTPPVTDTTSLGFSDVFGTGTATLVWSYAFAAQPEGNYKALDFCGGVKPYLLTATDNNMGTTTRVSYAPSTRYALEDRARGAPWITSLPFPVHVIDKTETIDHVSRTKFVTTFRYHHGYYDGREREFRGFGRVDQFDTESFAEFSGPDLHGAHAVLDNVQPEFHVPPVETRTWFHTGVYMDEDSAASISEAFDFRDLTSHFRREFYRGDAQAATLPEHDVVRDATPHDAYRALRGSVLRTETYAHDGSAVAPHPYEVTENRFRVRALRAAEASSPGIYALEPIETLMHRYERNPADPRVSHAQTLEFDPFLNPLRTLAISYGRRVPAAELPTDADRERQMRTMIVYTESLFTNAIDMPAATGGAHRTPLLAAQSTYELSGFAPQGAAPLFRIEEWTVDNFARLRLATEIPFEAPVPPGECRRRTGAMRARFRSDDLAGALPVGTIETLGLQFETYKLAFTPGLLGQALQRDGQPLLSDLPAVLADRGTDGGGYVDLDGDNHWWVPSGRLFLSPRSADTPAEELAYARQHFFHTVRERGPFHSPTLPTESFLEFDRYDLLMRESRDAHGNIMTAGERLADGTADPAKAGLDYRVLQVARVMDANRNRSVAAFDALGAVVATAVMGKPGDDLGDSLDNLTADLSESALREFLDDPLAHAHQHLARASTRMFHDLFAFQRSRHSAQPQPVTMCALARETHAGDTGGDATRLQITMSFFDGTGRPLQHKAPAEPGPVPLRDALGRIRLDALGEPVMSATDASKRWIASGWAQLDNKGNTVRQFQPFFSDTHRFEPDVTVGTSSISFYDPLNRGVAELHADHTWRKRRFDAWRSEGWDVNDTAALDPRLDPDVAPLFARLPDALYLPTWLEQRAGGALGPQEQAAAEQTLLCAGTPSIEHLDSLARNFLSISHNRIARDGVVEEAHHHTRVDLDIQGNQRAVIDALDRVIVRCEFDLLGRPVRELGMDTGSRWILHDACGKAIRSWDARGHTFRTRYDVSRRPLEILLAAGIAAEQVVVRMVYGDSLPDAEERNCRGTLVHTFDQAGVTRIETCDFKRNPLRTSRALAREYRRVIDWQLPQPLEAAQETRTAFDALNRPVSMVTPDGSVYLPRYNEAGLLDAVDVRLRGAAAVTPFVTNITYDAGGRRTRIDYGNGVRTAYRYNKPSHRLGEVLTTRADAAVLQSLRYTYDALGNVTHVRDEAQQTLYFAGAVVTPDCEYVYDAAYRLVAARGREHIGQNAPADWNDAFRALLPSPGDAQAMRRYEQRYDYDAAGNVLRTIHRAAQNGDWKREYQYTQQSLVEPARVGNRLGGTTVGATSETYAHDAHGNLISLPHLTRMAWDFKDQLRETATQAGSNPETTYYVYNAAGERVRKITDRADGRRKCERIYLGGFELYREYGAGLDDVRLERETLEIGDGEETIARVETRTRGETLPPERLIRFQLDSSESAALELDENGAVITYEEYYPYGNTSYQAGRSAAEVKLKRYRHAGMERDEESGLGCHGVRYYAPWLGRWTSADPAGIAGGLNLYCYAACDPANLNDTDGMEPFWMKVRRWKANKANGRAYDNAWNKYFEEHGDTLYKVRQSTWKDRLKLKTQYFLGGKRQPDFGVVLKTGLTLAVETGSPPSFEGTEYSTKAKQLRQDAEAIKRRYVLNDSHLILEPDTSFKARGLPVLGPEGNTPDSNKFKYEQKFKDQIKPPPKLPTTTPPTPDVDAPGGKLNKAGTALAVGGAALVIFGPGSAKDKAQALVVGYGVGAATDALAVRVIGAAGARALAGPIGLVLGMCSDQAGSCERQERAKAQREAEEDMRNRLQFRANQLFMLETAKGNAPEWHIVYQMAVQEEYVRLGLDKVDEQRRRRALANDPNSCSIYSPTIVKPDFRYYEKRHQTYNAR